MTARSTRTIATVAAAALAAAALLVSASCARVSERALDDALGKALAAEPGTRPPSAQAREVWPAERRMALAETLASAPDRKRVARVWPDVRAFYAARGGKVAWRKPATARRARTLIDRAVTHGLDPARYDAPGLARHLELLDETDARGPALAEALAAFDVRVTTALLLLGHDVAFGRIAPTSIDPRWKAQRTGPDVPASLAQAVDEGTLDDWLDRIAPHHPGYVRLRTELDEVRASDDPDRARIARIALNLDRWRWLPDDLGNPHLMVNIPDFRLQVVEGDRTVLEMPVIVGKHDGHETPVMSGAIDTVVFNPYWNIPDSIATTETAAKVREDAAYLSRNRIEVLRVSGNRVERLDPEDVDWDDPEDVAGVRLRQLPGAGNALGDVKFLFPNPYAVYLHDTPAVAAFDQKRRALSHGCVRVAKPEALAGYVLRATTSWDAARIGRTMKGTAETRVDVDPALSVHITYFTATVDADGVLRLLPDVYGYDARQQKLTDAGSPAAPRR